MNTFLAKPTARSAPAQPIELSTLQRLSLLDLIDQCVLVIDAAGRVQYVNESFNALWRVPLALRGQQDAQALLAHAAAQLREPELLSLAALRSYVQSFGRRWLTGADGRTLECVCHPLPDAEGSLVCLFRDITNWQAEADRESDLAFHDPGTGLPNRRLLVERVAHARSATIRTGRKAALLAVDMDDFRCLSDAVGHQASEAVLLEIAERLQACVRKTDTVARTGADEFVLLLEGLSHQTVEAGQQVQAIVDKIRAQLQRPHGVTGAELVCPASIGVVLVHGGINSVGQSLQELGSAVARAKAAGKNTVIFADQALQAELSTRRQLAEELQRSLAEDRVTVRFQPVVDGSFHLTGVEALARWNHPQRGPIAAGEFLPTAEAAGLLPALGASVLDAACRQLAAWALVPELAAVDMAVNISSAEFYRPEFAGWLLETIERTGANPRRLRLELNEAALLLHPDEARQTMAQLSGQGVRFVLDQFASGYSLLPLLKELPLEQIKIDRELVRELLESQGNANLIASIAAFGESLGIDVVAVGVESEAQLRALATVGCTLFQGHLVSQALVAEGVAEFVAGQ